MTRTLRLLLGVLVMLAPVALATGGANAQEDGRAARVVKVVAPQRLAITAQTGQGVAALYADRDLETPQPEIRRAVLVLHGRLRNADVYKRSADAARLAAGEGGRTSLMIVPQFLTPADVREWQLGPSLIRWASNAWMGGEPAMGPAPLSAFDVLDGILRKLADKTVFPALGTVVIAGHSGGGQVVARYAVVGKGEAALTAAGVHVRYVIANPSSYLYFSADRPDGRGGFTPFNRATCPEFNQWKYGPEDAIPYAGGLDLKATEAAFAQRDVIYLLGTADIDPEHPALDKSCGAEAQGPYRYARGVSYVAYLRAQYGSALKHRQWDVPGVGHNGDRMLTSSCGLAALFDTGTCTTER
jgi:pimeloyl-ACP methyl ester carboxylesterase